MLTQPPADVIKSAWNKIPFVIKAAFLSAVAFGILTHTFMFTNKLPNHDELAQMIGNFDHSRLGRWFIQFPMRIGSPFSMPWVSGFISITYISVAVALVVRMLKLQHMFNAVLVAGLMVTMPTVAGTFTYMQVSDSYFLALLLACLAAFLADRYRFGFLYAMGPLVFSLGIYQSYFGLTAGLLMMVLIIDVLKNDAGWKDALLKGLKFLTTLIGGLIVYLLAVRLTAPPEGLTAYQGIDQIGWLSLSQLPGDIANAYGRIAAFFLIDLRNFHYSFMPVVFVVSAVACVILLALLCYWKKMKLLDIAALVVLLILFPLACNIIFLMNADVVHDLMIYPTVLVIILPVVVIDLHGKRRPPNKTALTCCWVLTLSVALCIFNYWVTSNQVYFKLYMGYQQTFAQSTILMSRIQNTEGFTGDTEIFLVGTPRLEEGIPEMRYITITGARGADLFGSWAYPFFLQRFLNITQHIEFLSDGVVADDEIAAILAEMPLYPDYGSIVFIDSRIFVNFARPISP